MRAAPSQTQNHRKRKVNAMLNPYDGRPDPVTKRKRFYGREEAFLRLQNFLRTGQSAAVTGPEGVGKTSFLNVFFNHAYRRQMAEEEQTLICITDFPYDLGVIEIYQYLADNLMNALHILEECEDGSEYGRVYRRVMAGRRDCGNSASVFQQTCQSISECEYDIVIVIDSFERFVSSPNITMEHHSLLNNLISKKLKFVVATNYDFNEKSLPPDVSGSYLLQKFSNRYIRLEPFSREDSQAYLTMIAGEALFSPEEVKQLHLMSGGIPALLHQAAYHACEVRSRQASSQLDRAAWSEAARRTYRDSEPLMRRWCRLLTDFQISAIQAVCESQAGYCAMENSNLETAAGLLCGRGLMTHPIAHRNGQSYPMDDLYKLNSPLLRKYCTEHQLQSVSLEAVNWVRQEEQKVLEQKRENLDRERHKLDQEIRNAEAEGALLEKRHSLLNRTLVTADAFLSLLGFDSTGDVGAGSALLKLGGRLARNRLSGGGEEPDYLELPDVPETDLAIDESMEALRQDVMPDVDPDSLEDTDLDTLDRRFAAVRARMGLEEALSDRLLDSLSPLCRFYVKAALIVEHHMSGIMGVLNQDYSTHLVMYGKCLEQSLRDCFFPLFSHHQAFRDYDSFSGGDTPGGSRTFGAMQDETKAMLGTFYYMLKDRQQELADLCAQYHIAVSDVTDGVSSQAQWQNWWNSFAQSVRRAKNIRNHVHAGGTPPTQADLEHLRCYTFGDNGILSRSQIGRELYARLQAPEQRTMTPSEINALKGTVQQLAHCRLTEKNALDGTLLVGLEGCTVRGHMARKAVRQWSDDPQSLTGQTIQVELKEYDRQNSWFVVLPC